MPHAVFFGNSRGFVYVYAVEEEYSIAEVDQDVLVGQELVIDHWDGVVCSYSMNALPFSALDIVDADGNLFLDGVEYEVAPKSLHFPRFFGQNDFFKSKVIFVNLTGGTYFNTSADIELYNDNESVFITEIKIPSHDVRPLSVVFNASANGFLLSTNHDPIEPVGIEELVETGSLTITGDYSEDIFGTYRIEDASLYAVLVESIHPWGCCFADLPLQTDDPTTHNKAMLWSTKPDGGPN